MNLEKHLIKKGSLLKDALSRLNKIIGEKILFIVDNDLSFLGSITDGDIRRGLLDSVTLDQEIESLQQPNPKFFFIDKIDINLLIALRNEGYKVIPLIDNKRRIKQLIDFNKLKSFLPLDTIILAGGRGTRLSPLTKKTPKPLLKVGDKPIIKHNFDRLKSYGLKNFWISVNYLKGQIKDYFNSGFEDLNIQYIEEIKPMGTIGSLSIIKNLKQKHVLVTNSDLLTNINYEDFYLDFLKNDADISMVTIPYKIIIPYGVVNSRKNKVISINEKPTKTYYSNAGIYLIKRDILESIPKESFFNATDLINIELSKKKKVISYPFSGYWLDIGNHEDYNRAQLDIKYTNFD
tara:strand:+ start:1353 stop:2396 length:1044 start_codon:yes stop_codon:yes gene_type:complete